MAAVSMNFTLRDDKGETSQTSIHLPSGTTVALAQDHVEFAADLLDDLTGCVIDNASLTYDVPFDGDASLKIVPATDTDVQEGARFNFRTAGGYPTSIRIPGFLESKMQDNSTLVNQGDVQVTAFLAYMLLGDTSLAGDPTDYRGDDIAALRSAVDAFQRSRKRRR